MMLLQEGGEAEDDVAGCWLLLLLLLLLQSALPSMSAHSCVQLRLLSFMTSYISYLTVNLSPERPLLRAATPRLLSFATSICVFFLCKGKRWTIIPSI